MRRPSESGEGLLARLNGRAETPDATTRSARAVERAEGDRVQARPADAGPEVAADRPSPLIDPDPEDAIPVLAAGIDLETYAAPPVSADPDAQLASTRRPVSALRQARDSIRSESKREAEESPDEPAAKPIDSALPDLPDALPEDPFATDSPDPFRGLEPETPARDDEEVRPTSVLPENRTTDRAPDWVDRRQIADSPSSFEPTRLTDRLGMRMQRLRDRLTPKMMRSRGDQAIGDGPEEAKGFPRLFRRHRDGLPH
jgi:hypothetical protein